MPGRFRILHGTLNEEVVMESTDKKNKNRYLISDFTIVSALGRDNESTYARMIAGDTSGMKELDGVITSGEKTFFGSVALTDEELAASPTRIGALIDAALLNLAPAVEDLKKRFSPERIGVILGTSNSTLEEFRPPDKIDMSYPAMRIKEKCGLGGPCWAVSTACSSGAKVFSSARRMIENGVCDAVLVGGADAMTRIVVNGFSALEAVSSTLTRPLSPSRDGINLGEGAAIFILRKADEGETGVALLGVGETSDAYHLTAPDPEGRGAEAAMRAALADADLEPGEIDYVNLHGTGTTYNDSMECAAVSRVFGADVLCSSTKPLVGHALGAAGALEAALCCLAIWKGVGVPAHVTDEVDSSIAPFRTAEKGNAVKVNVALSNSFAFGGSNASVIFGRL